MRIVFALRADGIVKPGGDTKKIDHIVKGLSRHKGLEISVVHSRQELSTKHADVIHAVNLDLPFENLAYAHDARARGIPFVLSTVHHPWSGVQAGYRLSQDRFFMPMRQMRLTASTAVGLRELAKLSVRDRKVPSGLLHSRSVGAIAAQKDLARMSARLLPMSLGEAEALQSDLGDAAGVLRVLPNGLSFPPSLQGISSSSRHGMVAVGRIEPRKNSLELALAASSLGCQLTFVGALNEKHASYCRDFMRLVNQESGLSYLGRRSPDEVRDLLLRSDVYVNPSWYEVVSQADMEAASLGCRVATTRWSYIGDFLSGSPDFIDPVALADSGSRKQALEDVLTHATTVRVTEEVTWNEVADRLIQIYEELY